MKKNLFFKYLIYIIFFGLNLYSQDFELNKSPYNQKPLIASKELYEKDCTDKNIVGCKTLGDMYYFGEGVTQDYSKAKELYEKACNGGFMEACNNLGLWYELGDEIIKINFQKAKEFYKKSCDKGDTKGCELLNKLNKKVKK